MKPGANESYDLADAIALLFLAQRCKLSKLCAFGLWAGKTHAVRGWKLHVSEYKISAFFLLEDRLAKFTSPIIYINMIIGSPATL